MSRTKGSKNKVKEVVKYAALTDKQVTVTVKPRKAVKTQEVEEIKEIKQDKCCSCCKHESSKHYGSQDKWCNIQYCQCQQLA